MKKSLVVIAAIAALSALILSCGTWVEPPKSTKKYAQSSSMEVHGLGVLQVPTIADLEIKKERVFFTDNVKVSVAMNKQFEELLKGGFYRKKDAEQVSYQMNQAQKVMEQKAFALMDGIKQFAKSKLLNEYMGDILISPKYYFEIINNETIKVEVSGYIGVYKNFRSIQPKDTALFKVSPQYNPKIYIIDNELNGVEVKTN